MTALAWHREAFDRLMTGKSSLAHAFLVSGARGIGKLVFARALAQALLCEAASAAGHACGKCVACRWFEAGTHPDYQQIEPASAAEQGADGDDGEAAEKTGKADKKKPAVTITVDQIRALPQFINISSHRGGPKVIVIQPAEMLNVNAANALLKNLEEPPPRTQFILITHRPHQVLPTIRSRSQRIALPTPDAQAAAAWLAEQGVRDPALALAQSGGAPLRALELDDSEYWGTRAAFLRQLTAGELDIVAASDAISGFPVPDLVAWMQKWSYDIAYYPATASVRYNPDQEEAIARIASRAGRLAALRFHREMVMLQKAVHHPLNPRLFTEHLLLSYRDAVQAHAFSG
jgi:DNA polymerase-3 subunit delta'